MGTSFYISPEIANGWPQYDNKVDLYSLGVIAFELWHPFSTAMERVVVLRDLVETGAMPPGWPESHPVVRYLFDTEFLVLPCCDERASLFRYCLCPFISYYLLPLLCVLRQARSQACVYAIAVLHARVC